MNWYNFIFSRNRTYRLQRHFVFWLLWWVYFTVSHFHYQQTGLENVQFEPWNIPFLIKTILLLSILMLACYYFIYHLMPKYLFTSRYFDLLLQSLVLAFLIVVSSYFVHRTILPIIDAAFYYTPVIPKQHIWWTSITSGLLTAPKVITAAAAIILIKRWVLKQKEKERLEKEKLLTDLQLLRAQLHPEFLFSSLDNICRMVEIKESTVASVLLLKLADILSYILYECDHKQVLLAKEIKVIRDYLALAKTKLGERLELDIAVKGEPGTKSIAPLLLFSFIENCFSHINNPKLEQNWLNLEFQIEETDLTMKLIHGKSGDTYDSSYEKTIANAMKRLDFFYPGRYELRTTIEPEIMMITVKFKIGESNKETENEIYRTEEYAYATV